MGCQASQLFLEVGMKFDRLAKIALLVVGGITSTMVTYAGNDSNAMMTSNADPDLPSWKKHTIDFESGLLANVGSSTPIAYKLVPNQLSWRSPAFYEKHFTNESKLVIRNQASLLGELITNGPEDYYVGVSAAPSFEWWSPEDRWSLYFSIGGGVGLTNSQNVTGGMGQDFTLNWFSKSGVRYQLDQSWGVYGGAFFQHLSNGGQTDPNPGIDALGFTMGLSYSF